jgi:hypothetical protein
MTDAIKNALQKLDVSNDNHWTQDKQPRLETVKLNAADQSITREQVDEAFPGFNRATAPGYWMSVGEAVMEEGPVTSPPSEGAQESQGSSEGAGGPIDGSGASEPELSNEDEDAALGDGETEQFTMDIGVTGSDEVQKVEAELEEVRERLVELRQTADAVKKSIFEGVEVEDALSAKLDKIRPPASKTETIQAYLESQKRIAAKRGENRAAFNEAGVSIKDLLRGVGKSPIDESMARRSGRGTARPSRV